MDSLDVQFEVCISRPHFSGCRLSRISGENQVRSAVGLGRFSNTLCQQMRVHWEWHGAQGMLVIGYVVNGFWIQANDMQDPYSCKLERRCGKYSWISGFSSELARSGGLLHVFGVLVLRYDPYWEDLLLFGMTTCVDERFSGLLCFFSGCNVFLVMTACIYGDSAEFGGFSLLGTRELRFCMMVFWQQQLQQYLAMFSHGICGTVAYEGFEMIAWAVFWMPDFCMLCMRTDLNLLMKCFVLCLNLWSCMIYGSCFWLATSKRHCEGFRKCCKEILRSFQRSFSLCGEKFRLRELKVVTCEFPVS